MLKLTPAFHTARPLRLLCIGAHSDDIEIGCGGTILTWLANGSDVHVSWVVLSAEGARGIEARRSARIFLSRAAEKEVIVGGFRDGYLPAQYTDVKGFFEQMKSRCNPDVILTHWLYDRHQDHRLTAELTWNTWRDHLVLEYEIAKYEGDLAPPNTYVELSRQVARRKVAALGRYFVSQRSKDWFQAENFLALMRLRAAECRASSGFAEAFHARKLVL